MTELTKGGVRGGPPEGEAVRLGLLLVQGVGEAAARAIVERRALTLALSQRERESPPPP